MAINPSESDIQQLVSMYREAVRALAREFVAKVSLDTGELADLVQQAIARLDDLDRRTERWAKKAIAAYFLAVRKDTSARLSSLGAREWDAQRARLFDTINQQAIDSLLYDPQSGFVTALSAATNQIRSRLRSILRQARMLRSREEAVQSVVEGAGSLPGDVEGEIRAGLGLLDRSKQEKNGRKAAFLALLATQTLQTAGRDKLRTAAAKLAAEMAALKAAGDRVWKQRYDAAGSRSMFNSLGNLTTVRLPGAGGEDRDWSIDRYAETVARLKTMQSQSVATRNAILESGNAVLQIRNTLAKKDDACNLFIGRAYALTRNVADTLKIAHVDDLPEGGIPFHPNCTHSELPCVLRGYSEAERNRMLTMPPTWSLGKRWSEVQKEYKTRGGLKYAMEVNPNMKFAGPPAEGPGGTFRDRLERK